jgi:hypothetical protein
MMVATVLFVLVALAEAFWILAPIARRSRVAPSKDS